MSDTKTNFVWKSINYVVGLLPLGALFGLCAFVANIEIKDLDLWLHLGMGKYITLSKSVPAVDVLSATIQGQHWNNHEWLFQVLVYNIFNFWGADGLLQMQVVVVITTMLILLFLGYQRDRQFLTTLSLMLVYLVYQQRFTLRPDLFSLLFFAVFIYILSLHIDKKWALPVLCITQVLWVNMHGFFFFGPLFVAIGLFSEYTKRRVSLPYEWNDIGRLNDSEFKRLGFAFIGVLLACVVNPQFIKGAIYPLTVLFSLSGESSIFFKYIEELKRPITSGSLFTVDRFIYYKLLIVISFLTFVFNRRRIDISALLFWLIFLAFSLTALRNTPFFAFAAYIVIVTNCLHISFQDVFPIRFTAKKFEYLTMAFLNILLLMWLLQYCDQISGRSYYDFDTYQRKSEFGGVSLRSYPHKAADFLVNNNIKGNFYNDFNSGAYLIGRCFPNIKVFIDGRTEVYGAGFFKDYKKIDNGDMELFDEMADQYQLSGALLNSARQEIPKKLLKHLYESPDWKEVYFDFDGLIFLRNIPQNQMLIEEYGFDLASWESPKVDLLRLGSIQSDPYHHFYRAFTLEGLDFDDKALIELNKAIEVSPTYGESYNLLGKIYNKKEDFQGAFESFRKASIISPMSHKVIINFSKSYYDVNDYEGAILGFQSVLKMWPEQKHVHILLAKSLAKSRQYDDVLEHVKKGVGFRLLLAKDAIEVGDVLKEQGEVNIAHDVYEICVDANPDLAIAHLRLGESFESVGDETNAKGHIEKAFEIDPENEDIRKSWGIYSSNQAL